MTDFSTAADAAVDAAARIAGPIEGRVVLVHMLSVAPITHADFAWVPTAQEVEAGARKAEEALQAATARVRAYDAAIEVETSLLHGILPDDLIAAIAERQPDLVVVGTHGRGFWSSLVLGSAARAVTRGSDVPVLTVRPERQDLPAATVLVPVELGHVVEEALDFGVGLAAATRSKLRLLYVFPGADEIDLQDGRNMESDIARKANVALEQLAGREHSSDLQVESVTRFGRAARQIAEEATACNAAYVVMGTHARGFVQRTMSGSVAEDVLQIAGRAVVTCRVPGEPASPAPDGSG